MSIRKIILFMFIIIAAMSLCSAATSYKTVTTTSGVGSTPSTFIFNLWLSGGNAPANNLGEEIIISNFSYVGTNRTDGGTPAGSFEWSGYTWTERNQTLSAPGPCYWNSSNVWVDANNKLHLKISKVGDKWHCAELDSADTFGYGTFTCTVESDFDFDVNTVLGMFTYYDDTHEIDVEMSSWGDRSAIKNTQYSNQPTLVDTHQLLMPLLYNETTHIIDWKPGRINWYSMFGQVPSYNYVPTAASRTTTFVKKTGTGFLNLNDSSPLTMNVSITNTTYVTGNPTSGNTGFWPLNGTANDYNAGTKHHGTVSGTLAYSAKGAYFDGNDYITHADMASPVWVSWDMNTTKREQDIMSHWDWSSQYSWVLCEDSGGSLWLITSSTGSNSATFKTEPIIKNNIEQHYDMMFYDSRVYLYQDNICVLNASASSLYNSNAVFAFGLAQWFANYQGYMKNIRYYSSFPTRATQLWNQVGANATYVKAQPSGAWKAYPGSTLSVTDFGDMSAGLTYVANDAKLHTVSVLETYDFVFVPSPGIHEGYTMTWNWSAWGFSGDVPTNDSAWIGDKLSITLA